LKDLAKPSFLAPHCRLRGELPVLESPGRFEFGAVGKVVAYFMRLKGSFRNLPAWALALTLSVLLAIALIGANLVHARLTINKTFLDGNPGDLLYIAVFNGFTDEWDLYEGQQSAAVVDEQLELQVRSAQTAAWSTARPRFLDFDMTVAVTATAGPIDNAMGVIIHAQETNEGACDLPAVILCGIDQIIPLAGAAFRQVIAAETAEGHIAFLISSDGYYSLWKSEAGTTKLASAWIPSPQIKQGLGASNTIRVVAQDAGYRFYINGVQASLCLPEATGATSTFAGGECIDGTMREVYRDYANESGKLGLIAQSTATGGAGVVVRFDDLAVFSPTDSDDEDVRL